ncbi:MAG: response regulator transcription factor [Planctomycetota bacterium]
MSASKGRILIVEDDRAVADGLALNLRLDGFVPLIAPSGEKALQVARDQEPALILLDITLPGMNGLEVLRALREKGARTPVIALSARQDEYDKVAALRLGADDYVTKPFGVAELLARIDSVLRRAGGLPPEEGARTETFRFSSVEIDAKQRAVTRRGQPVPLTHLEFELLLHLVRHPSRVFHRHELLGAVWGLRHEGSARTIDNFVGQLRKKLEDDPENPSHFVTVRGSGYRFDP